MATGQLRQIIIRCCIDQIGTGGVYRRTCHGPHAAPNSMFLSCRREPTHPEGATNSVHTHSQNEADNIGRHVVDIGALTRDGDHQLHDLLRRV
jgi:hypothetical protein